MIKAIIVDDEPLALDVLEDYINQMQDIELIARCNSAAMAQEVLARYDIQLMFLDIHMPDVSGIRFLQSLKMRNRPLVVLTTAYNQYAIEGFELDVADYLMKPFSFERFLKTVHKVMSRLQPVASIDNSIPQNPTYIFVKAEYKTYKVDLHDIIMVEGLKDYSKIYTTSGHIMTLKSLKAVESMLPKHDFIRVHRSYIIAVTKIKVVSKNQITTTNDFNIPVSEGYRESFNAVISANQI